MSARGRFESTDSKYLPHSPRRDRVQVDTESQLLLAEYFITLEQLLELAFPTYSENTKLPNTFGQPKVAIELRVELSCAVKSTTTVGLRALFRVAQE